MSGAEGVPTEWLHGSPFGNYFIPSLILFVIVGGSSLFAAIAVFVRLRFARTVVLAAVFIVFGWLSAQLSIVGYVSWLQPLIATVAFIILIFAWFLPRT